MSHTLIASGAADVVLSSTGRSQVMIVAAIAIGALLVAGYLVREVLAASEGTDSMKNIAAAVQEGATAYLNRQFKTLSVFVVLVFFVLFLLPANSSNERLGPLNLLPSWCSFFCINWLLWNVVSSEGKRSCS